MIFNRVNEAYQTLINKESRKSYDTRLYFSTMSDRSTTLFEDSDDVQFDRFETSNYFNTQSTDYEEYKKFNNFVKCVIFGEKISQNEFAGVQSYIKENMIIRNAFDCMQNLLTTAQEESFDSFQCEENYGYRKHVSEPRLISLSRKISKPPKPSVILTKKASLRK